jgi:hypothetical protein
MAILTLAEYKTTPFYSVSQSDASISYFLEWVDDYILEIRGIPFFTFTGDLTATSTTISNVSDSYGFTYEGALIEGDSVRARITDINTDDQEITVDTAASATATDETITIYPRKAQLIAAEMVKWLIDSLTISRDVKSESIGTYSYTNYDSTDDKSGFPKRITSKIEQFQSMK